MSERNIFIRIGLTRAEWDRLSELGGGKPDLAAAVLLEAALRGDGSHGLNVADLQKLHYPLYLGDGVYTGMDEAGQIVLATSNGVQVTNVIYLDGHVLQALKDWLVHTKKTMEGLAGGEGRN